QRYSNACIEKHLYSVSCRQRGHSHGERCLYKYVIGWNRKSISSKPRKRSIGRYNPDSSRSLNRCCTCPTSQEQRDRSFEFVKSCIGDGKNSSNEVYV